MPSDQEHDPAAGFDDAARCCGGVVVIGKAAVRAFEKPAVDKADIQGSTGGAKFEHEKKYHDS
jgi:hypothetical protein